MPRKTNSSTAAETTNARSVPGPSRHGGKGEEERSSGTRLREFSEENREDRVERPSAFEEGAQLESIDLKQALALLDAAKGDEMLAAFSLAAARNRRAGAVDDSPDDVEVHHALAALRRARGLVRPSFDHVRSQLRQGK